MSRDGGNGWSEAWRVVPRLAGGALAVPVVVGFVALGVAVVAARSVRGLARQTLARLPGLRGSAPPPPPARPGDETVAEQKVRRNARGR